MPDRPGLLSRVTARALGAVARVVDPGGSGDRAAPGAASPAAPTVGHTHTTFAAPPPDAGHATIADGPATASESGGLVGRARRRVAGLIDGAADYFGGRFYEKQDYLRDVLDGGWVPRPPYSEFVIEMLGRTGLARRVLALRALDATREGWSTRFTPSTTLTPEAAGRATGRLAQQRKDLGAQASFFRAMFKAEQWGEAIVVMGVDDGRPMDQEIDESAVARVLWLKVFAKNDYMPGELSGPTSPNFGLPEWYDLHDATKPDLASLDRAPRQMLQLRVHHTRVLRFATEDGHSRLDEVGQALEDYFAAVRSGRRAGSIFSIAIFKVKGWIEKMVADEQYAVDRVALQKMALEKLGAVVVDKDNEDFAYQSPSLAGLADQTDRAAVNLCAWAGYPTVILMGVDPAGFSTGEEVIRRYYDVVRFDQTIRVEPQARKLDKLLMISADGPREISVSPDEWTEVFAPLRTLTAKEQADLRSAVYDGVVKLKTAQVIDRDEARNTLTQGDQAQVPSLQLSQEKIVDKPQERLEVGIVQALQTAVTAFYGDAPPADAERALWGAVVPELGPALAAIFTNAPPSQSIDPATGLPIAEQADATAEPAPTPGVPPAGEPTVEAAYVRTRYGVSLSTLKTWIREQRIRGWRTAGDRGRWRVLESEVAAATAHGQASDPGGVAAAGAGGGEVAAGGADTSLPPAGAG